MKGQPPCRSVGTARGAALYAALDLLELDFVETSPLMVLLVTPWLLHSRLRFRMGDSEGDLHCLIPALGIFILGNSQGVCPSIAVDYGIRYFPTEAARTNPWGAATRKRSDSVDRITRQDRPWKD
jgi:hypothetical protein